jgi:DNA-binding transcriptional ArsR family regulator
VPDCAEAPDAVTTRSTTTAGKRFIELEASGALAYAQLFSQKENRLPIRFRLAADELDRLAFGYSPLLEAVLSLHVLVEPKHHPLQHGWVREMRRLPPAVRREVDALSFLYRYAMPGSLLPGPARTFLPFERELEQLAGLHPDVAAWDFLRPVYDHGGAGPRNSSWLARPDVRRRALRVAREHHGPPAVGAVRLLLDDPAALRDRFVALLGAYWEAAFERAWTHLEPRLAETVEAAGRRLAELGLYGFLGGLSPRLRVEPRERRFGIDLPHEHERDLASEGESLVLVPSVFVWPHVRVNCDPPWPPSIVYPAPFVATAARPQLPPEKLVRVLRAVGETTRLRALRLIAEQPRSTQELAPLVGISEAGLSKHLRLLADAGLVQTRREGYYVLYDLVPESVGWLADGLKDFLAPD